MPSTDSAQGKAAQRARNSQTGSGNAGSSGSATKIANYPSLDWDEVEDEVVHVTDIAANIAHTQVGASQHMTAQINIPLAYAHALLDAHMASKQGLVYIRIYNVPKELFLQRLAERQAAAAAEYDEDSDLGGDSGD